jgi:hypothetical protein
MFLFIHKQHSSYQCFVEESFSIKHKYMKFFILDRITFHQLGCDQGWLEAANFVEGVATFQKG